MSSELARTTPDRFKVVQGLFTKSEKTIIELLPEGADVKRLIGGILMQIRINPTLLECTKESILFCGLKAFTLGLETTPELHQVAMVPFNRSVETASGWMKIKEAQLMIEYRGLISLALQSGELSSIDAYIVYEEEIKNGLFTLQYGLNPDIKHTPNPMIPPSKMGEMVGTYAVASFKNGLKKFHWMHMEEVYKRRDASKAYQYDLKNNKKDTPWIAWLSEQTIKTAIKGLSRTLQLSPTKSNFNQAASLDNMAMGGKTQIPLFTKEIEMLNLDVPGQFDEQPPNEEQSVSLDESDFGRATEGGGPEESKDKPKGKTTTTPPKQKAKQYPPKPAEKKNDEKQPENHSAQAGKKVDKSAGARSRVAKVLSDTALSDEGYKRAQDALDGAGLPCTDIKVFSPKMMLTPAVPDNYIEVIDNALNKSGLYK